MDNIIKLIEETISKKRLPWVQQGNSVVVELWGNGRKQKVKIKRQHDNYIFSSIVLRNMHIKNNKYRRNLAYRAWRKNDLKDLVAFAFDKNHNLIGLIEQPVLTLDHEELILYIDTLAIECDRFEYILTGEDYQ